METPVRGQAQPGKDDRSAEAAGTPETAQPYGGAMRAVTDHRATADDYPGELYRLGSYRVAVCDDGLQTLYQRKDPANAMAGARWRWLGFCQTRAALERLQRENSQHPMLEIAALPERFKRKVGQGLTSVGETFAVMPHIDWRATLAGLFDLKARATALRATPDRGGASNGP